MRNSISLVEGWHKLSIDTVEDVSWQQESISQTMRVMREDDGLVGTVLGSDYDNGLIGSFREPLDRPYTELDVGTKVERYIVVKGYVQCSIAVATVGQPFIWVQRFRSEAEARVLNFLEAAYRIEQVDSWMWPALGKTTVLASVVIEKRDEKQKVTLLFVPTDGCLDIREHKMQLIRQAQEQAQKQELKEQEALDPAALWSRDLDLD
jgi:hypothetical protein